MLPYIRDISGIIFYVHNMKLIKDLDIFQTICQLDSDIAIEVERFW
jgi:hypothetical protein